MTESLKSSVGFSGIWWWGCRLQPAEHPSSHQIECLASLAFKKKKQHLSAYILKHKFLYIPRRRCLKLRSDTIGWYVYRFGCDVADDWLLGREGARFGASFFFADLKKHILIICAEKKSLVVAPHRLKLSQISIVLRQCKDTIRRYANRFGCVEAGDWPLGWRGVIWRLFFLFFAYIPIFFSCLEESCMAVLLWSSRNNLCSTKQHE